MADSEVRYTAALARLRSAETKYAQAKTELILAQREVNAASKGTAWYKMLYEPERLGPEFESVLHANLWELYAR